MHFCLLVFHREDQDVVDMVMRYCDCCGEVFSGSLSLSEKVANDKDKLEKVETAVIEAFTPLYEPLEIHAELDYDNELLIYAIGKCDWFEIGGRWGEFLTDKNDGSKHDTLKASDVDMDKLQLIKIQYQGNYMLSDGVWSKLSETQYKSVEELLEDAIKDDLYVTIVDCHN